MAGQRSRAMALILNQDKRFETSEHPPATKALSYDKEVVRVAIGQVLLKALISPRHCLLTRH